MQENIKNIKVGNNIEGFYLLDTMTVKSISGGRSTIMLATLRDETGSIGAKIWNYDGPVTSNDAGNVVYVEGVVGEYNGALQATLSEFRIASKEEFSGVKGLVPSAPDDATDLWKVIYNAKDSIQDPDYKKVCCKLLSLEEFREIPAGKSVHHAFLHGLLMHTATMAKAAMALADIYGGFINRDLLIAGVLLHDIGKIKEFDLSPLGLVSQYSTEGQLMGHLVIGAQMVADAAKEIEMPADKALLLQHLILSHHGEPEYGAAVRPTCAEAFLLHNIDVMDARMETYREQLGQMQVGEMSNVIPALDARVYRHV